MTTINTYPNELQDTLNLEKAIRIGMTNNNNDMKDTSLLAIHETERITDICSKYYDILFQQACYDSIESTKEYVFDALRKMRVKERRRTSYNLHTQSILVSLDVLLHMQRKKIDASKLQLNKALGIDASNEFYLSSSFESIYRAFDIALIDKRDNKNMLIIEKEQAKYNNQV